MEPWCFWVEVKLFRLADLQMLLLSNKKPEEHGFWEELWKEKNHWCWLISKELLGLSLADLSRKTLSV